MNAQIEQIVNPFKTAYESVLSSVSDKEQIAGYTEAYNELLELADKHSEDMMGFTMAAAQSGLFARLATESQNASKFFVKQQKDPDKRVEISIDSTLNMYKKLYEDSKARDFFITTVAAYEEFLKLFEGKSNFIEVQLEAEKSGLRQKLDNAALYDTDKLQYDMTDPNELIERNLRKAGMDDALNDKTSNESTYKNELRAWQHSDDVYNINQKWETLYKLCKIWNGLQTSLYQGSVSTNAVEHYPYGYYPYRKVAQLCSLRPQIKKLYKLLADSGYDYDYLLTDQYLHKRILKEAWASLACLDMIFASAEPKNLDWLREVLLDEVMSDKTINELIYRKKNTLYAGLPSPEDLGRSISTQHPGAPEELKKWQDAYNKKAEKYYFAEKILKEHYKKLEKSAGILDKINEKGKGAGTVADMEEVALGEEKKLVTEQDLMNYLRG